MVDDKTNGWNEHAKLVLAELIRLDKNNSILSDEIKRQEQELRREILDNKENFFKEIKAIEISFLNEHNKLHAKFDEKFNNTNNRIDIMQTKSATIAFVVSTIFTIAGLVISYVK